jgi:DNA-binding IclR family transcriptional regulator
MSETESAGLIQTVGRIAKILRYFSESEGDLGVMHISRETGLHKSTASRLLTSLHKEGFIDKDPDTGKYRLGLGLVYLAGSVLDKIDLRQVAQNQINTLAELTQETINISVLDGNECINIESVRSPKSIRYAGQLGRKTPLHCTSTGKVLLAYLSPDERQKIISQPLTTYTGHTITDTVELEEALAAVRDQGYAISREEFEEGLVAIAVPLWNHIGEVVGALSVSGPTYRMDPETVKEFVTPLIEASQTISKLLGYSGTQ